MRAWWLVLPAAALRGVAEVVDDDDLAVIALAGSLVVLVLLTGSNRHLVGAMVVGLGLVLNLTAVVLNGGMPVRSEALIDARVVDAGELDTVDLLGGRHLETGSDRFAELGDIVPIRPFREVVSFGDLLVAFGALDAVSEVTRRRRRPPRVDQPPAPPPGADPVEPVGAATTAASVDHDWGTAPRPSPESGSQYSA